MKLFRRHNRFFFEKNEDGTLAVAGYAGGEEEILIPERHNGMPVTAVADGTFAGNTTLTSVILPDSITRIGEEAFRDCELLQRVKLSESLTDLPASAFRGCVELSSVNIPDAMKTVRPETFRDSPLRRLEIGKSLERLDPKPFYNGDYYRFTGNRKNTRDIAELRISPLNRALKIEGPAVLSADGKVLFAVLRDLTRYDVPEGVEVIEAGAFEGLYFLEQVRLPESLRRICAGAFGSTGLTSIHMNPGLQVVETLAFDHCRNLSSVTFEHGIREIGDRAFQSCPLKRVHLPASVSSVGLRSFHSLSKFHRDQIVSFTIDESNKHYRTDGKALYEMLGAPADVVSDAGPGEKTGAAPLGERLGWAPGEKIDAAPLGERPGGKTGAPLGERLGGKTDAAPLGEGPGGKTDAAPLGERADGKPGEETGATPLGERLGGKTDAEPLGERADGKPGEKTGAAHGEKTDVTGVRLNSLFGADYRGFLLDGRNKLSDYQVLPGTVSIGPGAFSSCNNLGGVSLPDGLKIIGESAFSECDNLPAVEIPDSVTEIREHAFRGTAVKCFVLPAGLTQIGVGAFAVGNEWDDKPSVLREIRVADGNPRFYTERKMLMRRGCVDGNGDGSGDGTINAGRNWNINGIGDHKSDNIGNNGNAVLACFAGEDEIAIPEDVTEICPEAFYKSPVKELWIPASVKKIGERAFAGCRRLRMLHIGFGDTHEQYAAVYIPDVRPGRKEHGDEVLRETIMNCVHAGCDASTPGTDSANKNAPAPGFETSVTAFDFATYDSLFERFDRFRDKMFIASERLRSGCMLTEETTDMYRSFLRNNAKAAMEFVISAEDLETLATLAELDVFTDDNIDELIELVNRSRKVEILSFLLDFKNRSNGIAPREEYDFSL